MFYYAQINEDSVCIGISQLSDEIKENNMIKIENYDVTILGKKYENGVWVELPKPLIEPTEEEVIIAQTFINQASIKEQLNIIDETNSKILLKITGGN